MQSHSSAASLPGGYLLMYRAEDVDGRARIAVPFVHGRQLG
jgi:hypothetical protein